MKRILIILFVVLFSGILIAADYDIDHITGSTVTINGTGYNCSSTAYVDSLPTDLGIISYLDLDTYCKVVEKEDVAALKKAAAISSVKYYYSLDKSNWSSRFMISSGQSMIGNGYRTTAYSHVNNDVDLSSIANGDSATIYIYFWANESATEVTDPDTDPTVNAYEATFLRIADISFTDGSAFTPSITPGNNNELIGRFQLEADVTGATFTDASIDLSGTRTGFSNFKLWASDDASYDVGDTQLGTTIGSDPGESPAVFSSFTLGIPTGGTYILLTADVDEEATGSIRGIVGESADLTVTDGEITSTISTAYMSNGGAEIPTPVELSSFTAKALKGKVELNWVTESETENDHFLIYRDGEVIGQVEGHGSTSEQHSYTYLDTRVRGGMHSYAIADVTYGGVEKLHDAVVVEVGAEITEASFVLNKAYPNPFNPRVTLSMEYGVGSNSVLNIYNTQGVLVDQLINGFIEAGRHEVTWDASNMPSGVYIVKMIVGDVMQSQKMVLLK